MKTRCVGLLLAACAALLPASAGAALTLGMASGHKASFGLADCNANAGRTVLYEGATVGNKVEIFMVSGSCPDTAPTDAVTLKAEATITEASVSGSMTVAVKDVTDDTCPAAKTIEKRICAIAQYEKQNYTTLENEWVDGDTAELLISYDSEPPDAPSLVSAVGGEGQVHLTWNGGDEATDWLVCLKKIGEPIPQAEDSCAAFQNQTQALDDQEGGTTKTGCTDTAQNNAETDVDCGGGTCPKCEATKKCALPSDCLTGVCSAALVCAAATCSDGVKNGDETDLDCGGSCTTKCAVDKACAKAADCASGVCTSSLCALAVNENPLTGCFSTESVAGASTRKTTLDGLVNGQEYELQMTALDGAGNYSPASNKITATPQLVFDFYERYRCAGGAETGGFGCSSGGAALMPLAALAALGLLRRRRDARSAL